MHPQAVVFTNLHPTCAAPTSTLTLLNGLGTYKIEASQSLRQIPAPGLDTLDVDVQAARNCDNEWCVRRGYRTQCWVLRA